MMRIKSILIRFSILMLVLVVALLSTAQAATPKTLKNTTIILTMPLSITEGDKRIKNILKTLDGAKKGDKIILRSQGYGGRVFTMMKLMFAISGTKADLTFIVTGPSFSAHAMITCAAKNLKLRKGSYLMFHSPSVKLNGGIYKVSELLGQLGGIQGGFHAAMQAYCAILTPTEMRNIIHGEDLYLQAKEVQKRLGQVGDKTRTFCTKFMGEKFCITVPGIAEKEEKPKEPPCVNTDTHFCMQRSS